MSDVWKANSGYVFDWKEQQAPTVHSSDSIPCGFEDALQHPWNYLEVNAFPLFAQIHQVMNQVIILSGQSMIQVTSVWPHQNWYPGLMSMLVDKPLEMLRHGTYRFYPMSGSSTEA